MAPLQRGAVLYSIAPCTDSGCNGGGTHGYWSGQVSRWLLGSAGSEGSSFPLGRAQSGPPMAVGS